MPRTLRRSTITQQLQATVGGHWTFDGSRWNCGDGLRYMLAFGGGYSASERSDPEVYCYPREYYIYEVGKPTLIWRRPR